MRVALVGFGSIGERHYDNLRSRGIRPVVLTKRDITNVDTVRNWDALAEQGPFDAIFITNETYKHTDSILRAAKLRPKGLFIEKPLTHTMRDTAKIRKVAKYVHTFFVGYSMQFFKPYLTIRKLLQKGVIGKPLFIRISVGQDLRAWRKRDYRTRYSAEGKKGGGVVLDLIHEINTPAWLLHEPLRFVDGVVGKISALAIRAEDVAESVFVSRSGVVVSTHQDYLQTPGRRYLEIAGTKGTLVWEWVYPKSGFHGKSKAHKVCVHTGKGERVVRIREERGEMYKRELNEFLRLVRSKERYSNLAEAVLDVEHAEKLKRNKL